MPGIFPDVIAGGVVTRDAAGVATNPIGVQNAYVPPSTFGMTCLPTALPTDCTGKFSPAQLNALVSELVCFASTINPSGNWNCASTCNLATNFLAWAGTLFDIYLTSAAINAAGLLTMTLSNGGIVTVQLGVSTDANNALSVGSDGRPYLAVPASWVII